MPPADDKRKAARETIDILHEISTLLVRPTCIQPVHSELPRLMLPLAEHASRSTVAVLLRLAN